MKRVDGNKIANDIRSVLAEEIRFLDAVPHLSIFYSKNDSVNAQFLTIKRTFAKEIGVEMDETEFPQTLPEEELISLISEEVSDPVVSGLVVQLPLPPHLDIPKILTHIPLEKDVDCISDRGLEAYRNGGNIIPPVAAAIHEILIRENVALAQKNIVILGRGRLVGVPAAYLFEREGAKYEIFDADSSENEKWQAVSRADIIISGMRQPGLITPEKIKEGVVLLDAGTSEAIGGATRGDADPRCEEKCSLFSSSRGGIGPITVAMLYKNLLTLHKKED